jgi:hypothetical protein
LVYCFFKDLLLFSIIGAISHHLAGDGQLGIENLSASHHFGDDFFLGFCNHFLWIEIPLLAYGPLISLWSFPMVPPFLLVVSLVVRVLVDY